MGRSATSAPLAPNPFPAARLQDALGDAPGRFAFLGASRPLGRLKREQPRPAPALRREVGGRVWGLKDTLAAGNRVLGRFLAAPRPGSGPVELARRDGGTGGGPIRSFNTEPSLRPNSVPGTGGWPRPGSPPALEV